MDFKAGQTVTLINRNGINALIGSKAVIKRVSKEFLYVKWITPQIQQDGAYSPYRFKPAIKKNQQLLFVFMDE